MVGQVEWYLSLRTHFNDLSRYAQGLASRAESWIPEASQRLAIPEYLARREREASLSIVEQYATEVLARARASEDDKAALLQQVGTLRDHLRSELRTKVYGAYAEALIDAALQVNVAAITEELGNPLLGGLTKRLTGEEMSRILRTVDDEIAKQSPVEASSPIDGAFSRGEDYRPDQETPAIRVVSSLAARLFSVGELNYPGFISATRAYYETLEETNNWIGQTWKDLYEKSLEGKTKLPSLPPIPIIVPPRSLVPPLAAQSPPGDPSFRRSDSTLLDKTGRSWQVVHSGWALMVLGVIVLLMTAFGILAKGASRIVWLGLAAVGLMLGAVLLRRKPDQNTEASMPARIETSRIPRSDVIDLLALVQQNADAPLPMWRKQDGSVISPVRPFARLELPVNVPSEYQVELLVERITGSNSLVIGLVCDGVPIAVVLGSPQGSGLDLVDGKPYCANETRVSDPLLVGPGPHLISCRVDRCGVNIAVGSKKVITWTKGVTRFALHRGWSGAGPPRLFLGAWESQFRFLRMTMTPVSPPGPDE
jgi:hypothetical protein